MRNTGDISIDNCYATRGILGDMKINNLHAPIRNTGRSHGEGL